MKIYFLAPLILQKLIWIPTRVLLFVFGNLQVTGLENLKNLKKSAIFVCNHASELDPVLIPASLPFFSRFSPIFYASREEKFYSNSGWRRHLYGGSLFKIWGAYPVFTGLKDYEKSLSHQIRIVRDSGSLCVFPEGRITSDGRMQPARGGVAFLAEYTNSFIVPVALSGVYKLSLSSFLLRNRKITVNFGPPVGQQELQIHVERSREYNGNVYREEAQYIMNKIRVMLSNDAEE